MNVLIIPEHLVNAIGKTLVYSLGQGVFLAIATALIVMSTRNRRPALRYNLLTGAMALFFICSLFTFVGLFIDLRLVSPAGKVASTFQITSGTVSVQKGEFSFLGEIQGLIQHRYQTVVWVWLLIVFARGVQFAMGLNRLGFLRKNADFEGVADWQHKLTELAKLMGIGRAVTIAQSHLTKVPIVVGYFKPLVLIPIGLLTALPSQQIEAILMHELAHIKRRDYLVNILQHLMEMLFFFNPAVLWLSALIRAERENCCDDMAVGLTNSKFNYISALVSCQEYQAATSNLAVAFSRKAHLKHRVQRLVYNNNHSLSMTEKSILALCVGVVSLALLAFSNADQLQRVLVKTKAQVESRPHQTTIRRETISEQRTLTTVVEPKMNRKVSVLDTDTVVLPKLTERAGNQELARLDSIRASLSTLKAHESLKPLNESAGRYKTRPRSEDHQPYKGDYVTATLGKTIASDLLKDGFINQIDDKLSLMLSDKELIVNGKLLSQSVHQKYKEKFVPEMKGENTWKFYHNYDTSTKVSP